MAHQQQKTATEAMAAFAPPPPSTAFLSPTPVAGAGLAAAAELPLAGLTPRRRRCTLPAVAPKPWTPCPALPPTTPPPTTAPATTPLSMGRRSEKIAGRKGKQDRAKTKAYARIGKTLIAAIKSGGSTDPVANRPLAEALAAAAAANFPKENIERAFERANSTDQADFKTSSFEVYGSGGVGLLVDVWTDNSNRASADIRQAVGKAGMKVASVGSVAFNFDRKGVVEVGGEAGDAAAEEVLMAAIDAGAEECEWVAWTADEVEDGATDGGGRYVLSTDGGDLMAVKAAMADAGHPVLRAELEMVPRVTVDVSDDDRVANERGVEALEDLDDVDAVWTTMA